MASKKKKGKDEETISVHLRLRPTKRPSGFIEADAIDDTLVKLNIPERGVSRDKGYVNNSKTNYNFKFSSVIGMDANQGDVFDRVGRDPVLSVLDGINATVFAYGQTGSGKTYTITGGVDSYEERGLIPRAISLIFKEFGNRPDVTYTTHISYLELYNESGFDLLDPSHETKSLEDLPRVSMMEDEDGNCHLRNLSMHVANSEEDALNLLFLGDTNRAIAETPMNMASSRSHCLFTIFVEGRRVGADTVTRAKLHMVDLAGSERVHKTNAAGQTLREATYINSSLFYLEMVIVALHEKATKGRVHVPYRNSMMTSVLRDSLGGNCKTVMVATASAESEQTEETISTCKFAQRVAMIKNSAIVNEDLDPTVMIGRLKGEVSTLKEEVLYLKGEAGEGTALDAEEIRELERQIGVYVASRDPYATLQIGKMTLTKLKDAFAIFKNLILEARANAASGGGEGEAKDGSATPVKSVSGDGDDGGESARRQVMMLQDKLKQRDQEIAILVNMVKQAKQGGRMTPGGGSGRATPTLPESMAPPGSITQPQYPDQGQGQAGGNGQQPVQHQQVAEAKHGAGAADEADDSKSASGGSRNDGRGQITIAPDETKEEAAARRLAARTVRGVNLTMDPLILQDAQAAFNHFRDNCARARTIEDNKRVLKEKYNSAKELAERVNATRGTITYLKQTIEQIRRERAMDEMRDGASGEGESSTPEEEQHMSAIEREKAVYKQSFAELRELKAAIEQIQKMLEKGRVKLQDDFDEWYSACLNYEARDTVKHGGAVAAAAGFTSASNGSGAGGGSGDGQQVHQARAAGAVPVAYEHPGASGHPQPAPGKPPVAPPVALTGNKDADDDILAFYAAKEELLRRQQQEKRGT